MRMKALGANGPSFRTRGGSVKPRSRPPPTAAPAWRKVRRESSRRMSSASSRMFDRGADARVGAAAADVAPQRRVDVGVGRVRLGREERGGGHDLAGLTVAALRSEEHTSELQSRLHLVCRLLLEKKKKTETKLTAFHRTVECV